MAKVTEGYMPFLGFETYYRVVGERKDNGKAPLICLHGGPGSTHNYYEVLDNLADDDDRQIIMYDQLGCGKSFLEGRGSKRAPRTRRVPYHRTVMGRHDADCICYRKKA